MNMKNEALMAFRQDNISVSAALPGFTQCYDGTILTLLELYGQSPKENLFFTIFNICNLIDRQDSNSGGFRIFLRGCNSTGNVGDHGQKTYFEVVSAHFWTFSAERN